MVVTYQDVLRANGALGSWALTEAAGAVFAPWLGGTNLAGGGVTTYRDAGPFAASFGLKLGVGGFLHLPFSTVVSPPVTQEAWFKLNALPVTSYELLLRAGVTGTNGNGFYVDPAANHVIYTSISTGAVDTGVVWPDLNWHLFTWSSSSGNILSIYLDGVVRWRNGVATPSSPAPNTLGFGSDGSADNSHNIVTLAYPTFYPTELSPSSVYATFLASTDPDSAMGYTTNGAGVAGTANSLLLNQILAAVQRTFPTT